MNKNQNTKPIANAVGATSSRPQNSRGITLIALIITIIVMLILVGVSIVIALNGGLFDTTKKAAKETEEAKRKEQELASGRIKIDGVWYDSLEDYAIGKESAIQGIIDLDERNTKFKYKPEGWTNGEVKVEIDASAVATGFTLKYSTDNINWDDYTAEITMSENGTIYAKLVDVDGKEGEAITANVSNIDKEAPIINIGLNSTGAVGVEIPLSINVTDNASGISKIEWKYKLNTDPESGYKTVEDIYKTMNGKEAGEKEAVNKTTTLTELVGEETYSIYAEVYDVAGNKTRSPETGTIDVETEIPIYADAPKDTNGILKTNAKYISDGKTAMVPKGFKIVNGIEGTQSIADGLVIQDKDGNEFVWIPVEVTASDTETSIASFYRSEWENNARGASLTDSTEYTEPYASGYTGEVAEYNAMVKSVYENKGFYIGRYEAGSTTQRTDTANETTTMVVKKNQSPYNYVGWGASMSDYTSDVVYQSKNQGKGAVRLSKEMYQNKDVGVTSTLCYSIQWDAMLDFIKDQRNVNDSSSWGNHKPADGKGQPKNTGSSDKYSAKNIYDIAGNVIELTMESYIYNTRGYRGLRGGNYLGLGDRYPASLRTYAGTKDEMTEYIGFRPTLYIK